MTINTNLVSSLHHYQTIMIYLATGDEVSCDDIITTLLWEQKTILIPYGESWVYEAVQLSTWDEVTIGKRWIRTVKDKRIWSWPIECIVCPWRLFTIDGKRKGRGWGRYDRFLAKHPESYSIGLCYSHQIVQDLVQNSWDIPMDKIIVI